MLEIYHTFMQFTRSAHEAANKLLALNAKNDQNWLVSQ